MIGGIEIFLAIILLSVLFSLTSSRMMSLIKLMALQGPWFRSCQCCWN